LPEGLLQLVQRSLRIHERIVKLDAMIAAKANPPPVPSGNQVNQQIDKIAKIFTAAR
jgi:hypothetical protein